MQDNPRRSSSENRLREIDAITENTDDNNDVDELLSAIVERIADLLETDTAAVLLMDPSGTQLIARAAKGIEEEVHQGARVPVGRGFAGRIAQERRSVILDRVDSTTVQNPLLWEKGIRSMLGAPLIAGGEVLGVVHVGVLGDRRFDGGDVKLLELAADRIAQAAQRRTSQIERIASRLLQRSLLPSALPQVPGLEFATRYVPAESGAIGGDWYDAFIAPSGNLWVMTGDLGGHGLGPAVVMGRLRSAVRAYALDHDSPADVLRLADRKLQFFEPGNFATVLCAISRPPFDSLEIASAGHPPPIMATPGKPGRVVDIKVAPPFGVMDELRPQTVEVDFPRGAVFVSCTDGLFERRGESIEVGLGRLAAATRADAPEQVCWEIMDILIGSTTPLDDIALIAVRRT